jgi:hypothetical protein
MAYMAHFPAKYLYREIEYLVIALNYIDSTDKSWYCFRCNQQ